MRPSLNYALLLTILLATPLLTISSSFASDSEPVTKNNLQEKGNIIITTDKLIEIEIKNATLYEALKAITVKSKIDFDVTENLLEDRITFQVKSPDWPVALKKLLKKYNYATSWKENKLIKVFIFEHGSGKSIQLRPPIMASPPLNPGDIPSDLPENTESPAEEMIAQELIDLPLPEMDGDRMIEIEAGLDNSGSLDEPDPYQEQLDVEAEDDEHKEPPRPENDFPLPDNLPGTMPE